MGMIIWPLVGGVVGLVTYGAIGAMIGVFAGILLNISDQLNTIIKLLREGNVPINKKD